MSRRLKVSLPDINSAYLINMKFIIKLLIASLFTAFVAVAAEKEAKKDAAKEVTLTGWGQCAKCALGLTPACQTAIVVTENGKEETFFLSQNAISQDFHSSVCSGQMQIKVTGLVTGPVGEREIAASKIEPVKK